MFIYKLLLAIYGITLYSEIIASSLHGSNKSIRQNVRKITSDPKSEVKILNLPNLPRGIDKLLKTKPKDSEKKSAEKARRNEARNIKKSDHTTGEDVSRKDCRNTKGSTRNYDPNDPRNEGALQRDNMLDINRSITSYVNYSSSDEGSFERNKLSNELDAALRQVAQSIISSTSSEASVQAYKAPLNTKDSQSSSGSLGQKGSAPEKDTLSKTKLRSNFDSLPQKNANREARKSIEESRSSSDRFSEKEKLKKPSTTKPHSSLYVSTVGKELREKMPTAEKLLSSTELGTEKEMLAKNIRNIKISASNYDFVMTSASPTPDVDAFRKNVRSAVTMPSSYKTINLPLENTQTTKKTAINYIPGLMNERGNREIPRNMNEMQLSHDTLDSMREIKGKYVKDYISTTSESDMDVSLSSCERSSPEKESVRIGCQVEPTNNLSTSSSVASRSPSVTLPSQKILSSVPHWSKDANLIEYTSRAKESIVSKLDKMKVLERERPEKEVIAKISRPSKLKPTEKNSFFSSLGYLIDSNKLISEDDFPVILEQEKPLQENLARKYTKITPDENQHLLETNLTDFSIAEQKNLFKICNTIVKFLDSEHPLKKEKEYYPIVTIPVHGRSDGKHYMRATKCFLPRYNIIRNHRMYLYLVPDRDVPKFYYYHVFVNSKDNPVLKSYIHGSNPKQKTFGRLRELRSLENREWLLLLENKDAE